MRPKKVVQSPMQRMNEACCKAAELMLEEMKALQKTQADNHMGEQHKAAAMARLGAAIAQLKIGAEPPDWAALMKADISSGFGASALLDRSDVQ